MTPAAALVVAGPGTNRDTDAVLALDLAGAEPSVVLAGELTARPELLDDARIVVVAGGFSYGDALGAGRMLALDLTAADGGRLGERLRAFVASGRPVVGICNGFQVLTRTGLLPGRARPQRRRPLRLPVGRARRRSRPAAASGPPGSTTTSHCPIAHGEGRYVHPDPDALAAAGQVALRYAGANPNGSVADIAGVCDETGVVLGLMPHPENHVRRPPAPAPPARPDDRRARSGCACSKRRCAMSSELDASTPLVDIDLPLPDRRDGKVRVSYALGDRRSGCSSRPTGCRRSTASSPACRTRARCSTSSRRGGSSRPPTSSPTTSSPCPTRTCWSPGPRPRCRSRSSCAATSPASRRRRCGSRTRRGARTIYGHHFPDGLRKNTRLPEPIVTPTTKPPAGSTVHDEPLTWAEVVERGLVDGRRWEHVTAVALELFRRGQQVAAAAGLILADTKYEFGVTADGELLLIDEVHTPDSSRFWVAATYDERLAAGEEPESLDKEVVRRALHRRRLPRRRRAARPSPADVWTATSTRYIDAYQRLTGLPFEPGATPADARIAACVDALREDL